ncbi:hypothetical protein ACQPTN_24215 [Bradyrhizobium sp. 13971]
MRRFGGPDDIGLLARRLDWSHTAGCQDRAARSMKNGLYSIHIHMTDGVRGRDSGILILRDGLLIGGGPYFWSIGAYTAGEGTWKGHLAPTSIRRSPTRSPVRCSPGRK